MGAHATELLVLTLRMCQCKRHEVGARNCNRFLLTDSANITEGLAWLTYEGKFNSDMWTVNSEQSIVETFGIRSLYLFVQFSNALHTTFELRQMVEAMNLDAKAGVVVARICEVRYPTALKQVHTESIGYTVA